MATVPGASVELRLALVCYGGVSLAIYMHGITKELHKLISASRAFDAAPAVNPFGADDTRAAYFDALVDLAAQGRAATVSIDIVAGTSAGGINGICLAKVLARNGSQDALKSLWIEQGDFRTLLRSPGVGGWKTRALIAAIRVLRQLNKNLALLRGDLMSTLLYDAIAGMDKAVEEAGPLRHVHAPLDLYVTATDLYGASVPVATGAGGVAQRETDHAQVFHFRADASGDDLSGSASTAPLAFAARATSCFPGAFPSVSRRSFAQEVSPRPVALQEVAKRFRNRYGAQPGGGYRSDDAWFADGGVLDNAPFDLVVPAIGEKRAETEVVRRLVYIEPDPSLPLTAQTQVAAPRPAPGYAAGLRQGALTVRGKHSFLRELLKLRDLNLRIEAIGAIAKAQRNQVSARVSAVWAEGQGDAGLPWEISDLAGIEALADRIYLDAPAFLGAGYVAYQRLKVEAAAERFGDALSECFAYPPDSGRSSFVRAVVGAWARGRMDGELLNEDAVQALLGPVDVPYRERRLMFVLAGINELYGLPDGPPRADLDALKGAAWTLLADVRGAARAAAQATPVNVVAFLQLEEEATFDEPEAFAAAQDEAFAALYGAYRDDLAIRLASSKALMWRAFDEVAGEWKVEYRQSLLSRFLGFPLWDGLIFPTISLSQLPQFTPIDVAQFSPVAARALSPPDPAGKLKGVALHHFGAFAKKQWRTNDYLWGRLDGAELILRMLRETGSGQPSAIPGSQAEAVSAAGPRLGAALTAVLTGEIDIVTTEEFSWLKDAVAEVASSATDSLGL